MTKKDFLNIYPAMPSLDAAKSLLKTKTNWAPLDSVTNYDEAAVYFLRTSDNLPIERWKAKDAKGLLYIGLAGMRGGNMHKRSRQLAEGSHQVAKRLKVLARVCPSRNGEIPICKYSFIKTGSLM